MPNIFTDCGWNPLLEEKETMFFAGGPGQPVPLHDYIVELLQNIGDLQNVLAGFAYATNKWIS